MLLVYLSCAWIAGIFLGNSFRLFPLFIFLSLCPLPLIFFMRHRWKPIVQVSAILLTFLLAAVYSYNSLHAVNDGHLQFYNDRSNFEIKGTVARDPEVRDKNVQLRLEATEIKLEDGWQRIEGAALLFVPRYPAYAYGDVLLVTGKPQTPQQLGDFDYRGYLAHQGISTTIYYPRIKVLARGKGMWLPEGIYSLRNRLAQTLAQVLPEPQASLAQGLVLGIRAGIPSDVKADFTRSGTAHLLAISGFNLSIIAGILLSLGLWLFGRQRYIYIWFSLSGIWLYALLTGMQPPVVRAAIMASLFLAAELFGRQRRSVNALVLAAATMVGVSPYVLWDASFQLSFLAMAGLVFIYPALQAAGRKVITTYLGETGTPVSIAVFTVDSLSATLAATFAIYPLLAHYFGIVAIAGPLATLLALPVLPGIIVTGMVAGLVGLLALPLAQVVGWLGWLLLSYVLMVAGGLANSPLSYIEVRPPGAVMVSLYYTVLAAAILTGHRFSLMKRISAQFKSGVETSFRLLTGLPHKLVVPPMTVITVFVWLVAFNMPDDRLHVSFLDVGQGDAILLQKGSQQVLIDGGPSPQALNLALSRKMPFWDRTIDLVILTHPHDDHLAGAVETLRRFQVKQVLYPELPSDSLAYAEWHQTIEAKNISYTVARAGQQFELGEKTLMRVLHPQASLLQGTDDVVDNNSLVLRLSSGNVSFLFTADIRQEAEWELVRQRPGLSATVLKIAHHGAVNATTAEFLAAVRPELALISAGAGNKFGHPSPEVVRRLTEKLSPQSIFRTDRNGTIDFITDGQRLWVKTESKSN